MSRDSKITVVNLPGVKPPPTKDVSDIPLGTAFTGSLMDLYGSPYTGVFLKQGRSLMAFGISRYNPGNMFFDTDKGSINNYQEVDLEIKVIPHVD